MESFPLIVNSKLCLEFSGLYNIWLNYFYEDVLQICETSFLFPKITGLQTDRMISQWKLFYVNKKIAHQRGVVIYEFLAMMKFNKEKILNLL